MVSPVAIYSQMQPAAHEPVVENASLPRMDEVAGREAPSPPAGGGARAAGTEGGATPPSAGRRARASASDRGRGPAPGGDLMQPFIPSGPAEAEEAAPTLMTPRSTDAAFPEQEAKPSAPAGRAAPGAEGGYVRLTFRVAGGQMVVTDARAVPGPVVTDQRIGEGDLAYELTREGRRLTAGVIPPTAYTVRGLPHPEGKGELAGHHITPLGTFEFTVRVPRRELTAGDLPGLHAAVYRVKGGESLAAPHEGGPALEAAGGGDRLRLIAEMKGIDLQSLPEDVQAALRSGVE